MINTTGIDLAALVERAGITLKGGAEKCGPCPKCGGTDRFRVRSYQGNGYFFCRGCHEKRGDAIEWMQWHYGMTFAESLAALGLRGNAPMPPAKVKPTTAAGIEIPAALDEPPANDWQTALTAFVEDSAARLWTPAGETALNYLRGRGLSDDTIKAFRLGWHWPANALGIKLAGQWWAARGITIPRTYAGELWAVNVRRSKADYDRADDGRKLMLVSGSKAQLFNGDALAGDARAVVVCEGEFDCMLAQQHAPADVACVTFGSKSIKPSWEAKYLLRGKLVYIAFDNDAAGDEGAAKWAALGARVRVPSGKDITDYARAGGDVGAWIAETTNVYSWQAPADEAARVAQGKSWLAVFDDETQPDDARAVAWARVCVCMGEMVTSDGRQWLTLAQ